MNAPRYLCLRCGNCCRWPGFVRVTDAELQTIAEFLGIALDELLETFTDLRPSRVGLMLKSNPDGSCIFLEGPNTCIIDQVKPQQCRDFPHKWRFDDSRHMCHAIDLA